MVKEIIGLKNLVKFKMELKIFLLIFAIILVSPIINANELSNLNSLNSLHSEIQNNKIEYSNEWVNTNLQLFKEEEKGFWIFKTKTYNQLDINNLNTQQINSLTSSPTRIGFIHSDNTKLDNSLQKYAIQLTSTKEFYYFPQFGTREDGTEFESVEFYTREDNLKDQWNEHRIKHNFNYLCSQPNANCTYEVNGNFAMLYFNSYKIIEDHSVTNVSECKTISDAGGGTYQLNKSISSTGSCMNVYGVDLIFDLNGYTISGDGGVNDIGIFTRLDNNVTITGAGEVKDFGIGIYSFEDEEEMLFKDLTISYNKNTCNTRGLYVKDAVEGEVTIRNITFDTFVNMCISAPSWRYEVQLDNSPSTLIENINATSSIMGASTMYGIYCGTSDNVLINNSYLSNDGYNTGSYGIYVGGCDNMKVKDTLIENFDTNAIWINTVSQNLTAINTTYTGLDKIIGAGNMTRAWYYKANITDTLGRGRNKSTITILSLVDEDYLYYDFSSDLDNGLTPIFEVAEYYANSTNPYYLSNYSIQVLENCLPQLSPNDNYNISEQKNNLNDVWIHGRNITDSDGLVGLVCGSECVGAYDFPYEASANITNILVQGIGTNTIDANISRQGFPRYTKIRKTCTMKTLKGVEWK